MLTVWEYAEQVAAGETGCWRAATRRAAGLLAAEHPTIELPRIVPMQQILLQTTALLVYGLARSRHIDPSTVTGNDLAAWVTQRPVPAPPDPDDTVGREQWTAAAMRWIPAMNAALQQQRDDLADLVRAAGHEVPSSGERSLTRHSQDPVVALWHDLVDRDTEAATYGYNGGFTEPLLGLGLAAITDTFGSGVS